MLRGSALDSFAGAEAEDNQEDGLLAWLCGVVCSGQTSAEGGVRVIRNWLLGGWRGVSSLELGLVSSGRESAVDAYNKDGGPKLNTGSGEPITPQAPNPKKKKTSPMAVNHDELPTYTHSHITHKRTR